MNDLQNIVEKARKKGLCDEWYFDFLNNHSLKHLCNKFFAGSDWAMENDFPDLETLRKFKKHSSAFGIHTDSNIHIEASSNQICNHAFFGNSKCEFIAHDFTVADLIVRHKSELTIKAKGYSCITLNALDDAIIHIKKDENAKVLIYRYKHNGTITTNGVTVKDPSNES